MAQAVEESSIESFIQSALASVFKSCYFVLSSSGQRATGANGCDGGEGAKAGSTVVAAISSGCSLPRARQNEVARREHGSNCTLYERHNT